MGDYHYKYPMQSVTADSVVFFKDEVLLIKRNIEPFKGKWALPGGHLDQEDKNVEMTADRELEEETGIKADDKSVFLKDQVGAYSQIDRDPRGRYVAVAYYYCMLEKPELKIDPEEIQEAKWFNVFRMTEQDVAFDHYQIIKDAHSKMTKALMNAPGSINDIITKWQNIIGNDIGSKYFSEDKNK